MESSTENRRYTYIPRLGGSCGSRVVTINVTDRLLSPIDECVKSTGVFPNRSQFFRLSVIFFLREFGYDTGKLEMEVKSVCSIYTKQETRNMQWKGKDPNAFNLIEHYIEKARQCPIGNVFIPNEAGTRIITIGLTTSMIDILKKITKEERLYTSRSELLRTAATLFLKELGYLKLAMAPRDDKKNPRSRKHYKLSKLDMRTVKMDDEAARQMILDYLDRNK